MGKLNTTKVCHFCGKKVTEDEYCFGCGNYVCSCCDKNEPFGDHKVEEHRSGGGC